MDFFSDSVYVNTSRIYTLGGLVVTLSRCAHRFMQKLTSKKNPALEPLVAPGDPSAPNAKNPIFFFQRVARTTTHFSRLYYDGRTSPERSKKILLVGLDLETSTYEDLENLDLNSELSWMSRCHQSDCQKLNFVYSGELRTFSTSETF